MRICRKRCWCICFRNLFPCDGVARSFEIPGVNIFVASSWVWLWIDERRLTFGVVCTQQQHIHLPTCDDGCEQGKFIVCWRAVEHGYCNLCNLSTSASMSPLKESGDPDKCLLGFILNVSWWLSISNDTFLLAPIFPMDDCNSSDRSSGTLIWCRCLLFLLLFLTKIATEDLAHHFHQY